MRQRSFLDDEAPDIKPRPRARVVVEKERAVSDDPLILLGQMVTVLHMPTSGKLPWHARAKGCSDFGSGNDPMEAMQAAMRIKP